MNIEELTIGQLNQLSKLIYQKKEAKELPFEIGRKYFIRTITYHFVGLLIDIKGDFLIFKQASWIADDGRFSNLVKTGEWDSSAEIEPFYDKEPFINLTSIIDGFEWKHDLPKEQK
jgi:hypothetical protein